MHKHAHTQTRMCLCVCLASAHSQIHRPPLYSKPHSCLASFLQDFWISNRERPQFSSCSFSLTLSLSQAYPARIKRIVSHKETQSLAHTLTHRYVYRFSVQSLTVASRPSSQILLSQTGASNAHDTKWSVGEEPKSITSKDVFVDPTGSGDLDSIVVALRSGFPKSEHACRLVRDACRLSGQNRLAVGLKGGIQVIVEHCVKEAIRFKNLAVETLDLLCASQVSLCVHACLRACLCLYVRACLCMCVQRRVDVCACIDSI